MERLGALTPRSRAMPGRAVASTVPSICSMKTAAPTISATVRKWGRLPVIGVTYSVAWPSGSLNFAP